jgi:phage shock protein A
MSESMIEMVPFADLKKRLAKARKIISEQASRVSVAEKQVRDIAKDRDTWQARALSAEAKIMSFGIGAALSEKP